MIRIAVMYKNESDKKFDMAYYCEEHMPMVRERYAPYGLTSLEMDEAVNTSGDDAAPYIAIAYMTFPGMGEFVKGFKAVGKEVMSDIGNFTDIKPTVQISKVVEF